MVAPLMIAGGALAAGGLAGSIFGKKKVGAFDPTAILGAINQGGIEQRGQISQLRPETTKQLGQYEAGVNAAQVGAKTARDTERARYLSELDPITSRLLQSQTDQLKRSTLGAVPEAQQAAREALAASGGLQRGVAAESLARIPIQAAQTFGEGAADLQQQSLGTMQDALANLHSEESQAIAQDLGIDADTYKTILATGNQALIEELNALVDESKRRTGGIVDAETARQQGRIAQESAEAANRQAIFSSLTNLGGTMMGAASKKG